MMKFHVLIFYSFWLFPSNSLFGQNDSLPNSLPDSLEQQIIYNTDIKFKFERFSSSKVKKLKQGKTLRISEEFNDTTRLTSGNIYSITEDSITVETLWSQNAFESKNYSFKENFDYEDNHLTSIPLKNIKSLYYENNTYLIPSFITYASLMAGILFAPIIAIDKNAPHNFNVPRYGKVLLISAIGTGIGVVGVISLSAGQHRFQLKPKFVY